MVMSLKGRAAAGRARPKSSSEEERGEHTESTTSSQRVGSSSSGQLLGRGHLRYITNHISVGDTLLSIIGELVSEIEPIGVKLLEGQLVETKLHSLEDVVHETTSPTNRSVAEDGAILSQLNLRNDGAEPNRQDIISRSVDRSNSVLDRKVVGASQAQADGNVREPIALLNSANKVGNRIRSTVHETFHLTEGGQIDKHRLSRRQDRLSSIVSSVAGHSI